MKGLILMRWKIGKMIKNDQRKRCQNDVKLPSLYFLNFALRKSISPGVKLISHCSRREFSAKYTREIDLPRREMVNRFHAVQNVILVKIAAGKSIYPVGK